MARPVVLVGVEVTAEGHVHDADTCAGAQEAVGGGELSAEAST